jgi:hypothetical protein
MHKTVFVSALTLALAISGTAFAQSAAGVSSPPSTEAATPQKASKQSAMTVEKVTQDLKKVGFSDVKVLEDSFLIQAKTRDGNPVLMTLGPNGMSALEVSNASGTGQAPVAGQTPSNNKVAAGPAKTTQH